MEYEGKGKTVKDEIFISVENGSVIKVLDASSRGTVVVGTVTITGRVINQRTMGDASLHTSYLNSTGKPWKTGYVKADQLPENHPYAYRPARAATISVPTEDPEFSDMTTEALAEYANRRLVEAKLATDLAEKAKEELRKRQPRNGVTIFGNTAVVASRPMRFDAALAKANLNKRQLDAISVSKPDATLAKKVLGADSPVYRSVCKEGKITLTIRTATDEDRQAAEIADTAESVADNDFRIGGFLPQD
ncbi:MAG: hypothetical protein IJI97_07795 [Clostridia bacterium]|nr:hypothetical protein [Clostridia bacterium]